MMIAHERPSAADIMSHAMSFDMSHVVARYVKDTGVEPTVALAHERELKRFLALGVINDAAYGMAGEVDELWHTFLLFTRDYASFCESVAGGFIHHSPLHDDKEQKQTTDAAYQRFLGDYIAFFGEKPPTSIWPPRHNGPDVREVDPSCASCSVFVQIGGPD